MVEQNSGGIGGGTVGNEWILRGSRIHAKRSFEGGIAWVHFSDAQWPWEEKASRSGELKGELLPKKGKRAESTGQGIS